MHEQPLVPASQFTSSHIHCHSFPPAVFHGDAAALRGSASNVSEGALSSTAASVRSCFHGIVVDFQLFSIFSAFKDIGDEFAKLKKLPRASMQITGTLRMATGAGIELPALKDQVALYFRVYNEYERSCCCGLRRA